MKYPKNAIEKSFCKDIIKWFKEDFYHDAFRCLNYQFNIENNIVKTFKSDNVTITLERYKGEENVMSIISIESKTKGFLKSFVNTMILNGIDKVIILEVLKPNLYEKLLTYGFKPLKHYYGSAKTVLDTNLVINRKIH